MQHEQHPEISIPRKPTSSSSSVSVARAGIPDPETATQAVTMRRTGALEAASLSFHNPRLDLAAKKLGIQRPPSAGRGSSSSAVASAAAGGGSRFSWKNKSGSNYKVHELEKEARDNKQVGSENVSGVD